VPLTLQLAAYKKLEQATVHTRSMRKEGRFRPLDGGEASLIGYAASQSKS
jgi:hypothetical protein